MVQTLQQSPTPSPTAPHSPIRILPPQWEPPGPLLSCSHPCSCATCCIYHGALTQEVLNKYLSNWRIITGCTKQVQKALNAYLLIRYYLVFAYLPSHIIPVILFQNDNTMCILILHSIQVTVVCIISFNFLKNPVEYMDRKPLFLFHRWDTWGRHKEIVICN